MVPLRVGLLVPSGIATDNTTRDFFNDLIETDILYVALFPSRAGNRLDPDFFAKSPNQLARLLPAAAKWENVVRVIDSKDSASRGAVRFAADTIRQRFICHIACGAGNLPAQRNCRV